MRFIIRYITHCSNSLNTSLGFEVMSRRAQRNQKAVARAARIDAEREMKKWLLILLSGGILVAAASLGRLLLMSP